MIQGGGRERRAAPGLRSSPARPNRSPQEDVVRPVPRVDAVARVEPAPAGAPGRPRDPAIDAAVLAATRELLLEVGYTRLSFALIAERAGVTRPTIYRRWPSKAHVVFDSVIPDIAPITTTASFADDLRAYVRRAVAVYREPATAAALAGLTGDLYDNPPLRDSVIERSWTRLRQDFVARVAEAVRAGQVDPAVDPDSLLVVINGAVQHAVILRDERPDFGDVLTDTLLRGLEPRAARTKRR
jgi:AcrR family transcriptional regulator